MPSGREYEEQVAEYYQSQGYYADLTPHSHDFGADIILYDQISNKRIVVQTKYISNGNIGIRAIQEITAAINHYNADEGWVITNSGFTPNAIELARSNDIKLKDYFNPNIYVEPPQPIPRVEPPSPPRPPPPQPKNDSSWSIIFIFLLIIGCAFGAFMLINQSQHPEVDPILESANELYYSGQYSEAIKQYDLALENDPKNPIIYFNQGTCYGVLNFNNEAILCFTKAIELDPTLAMAWNNKGVAYAKLNKPSEASAAFTKAYSLDPNNEIIKKNYETSTQGQSIPKQPTPRPISNRQTIQTTKNTPLPTQVTTNRITSIVPTINPTSIPTTDIPLTTYPDQIQQNNGIESPPMEFWGNVTVAGNLLPINSIIVAKIGDVESGKIITTIEGKYGDGGPFDERLKVYIKEEDVSHGVKVVTFWNNGKQAKQTVEYKPATSIKLNLAFD